MTAAKEAASSPKAAEKSQEDNLSGYKVEGARIQVTVGSQVLQFSEGDVLPKGIDDEALQRLVDRGLVAKSE